MKNKKYVSMLSAGFFLTCLPFYSVDQLNAQLVSGNKTLFPNQQDNSGTTVAESYTKSNTSTPDTLNQSTDQQLLGLGDQFGTKITPEIRKKLLNQNTDSVNYVFGQNLFQTPMNIQIPQQNPEYIISIGDKISINIWGALEISQTFTVDSQGNIFITKIGPIHIVDLQNKQLNQVIEAAVKSVYKDNIFVYANLLTAQPVKVYVSGYVARPGLYDGLSSNSILYFLTQAGGILLNQGSFRSVKVIRNGNVVRSVDLYDFLLKGSIPYLQFQQHDSIVVGPSLTTLEVSGQVLRPAQYEPTAQGFPLKEIYTLSGAKPDATYVLVEDLRGLEPIQTYIPIGDIKDKVVYGGEKVTFVTDQNQSLVRVVISGSIFGPRQLVVPLNTTMDEVMKKVRLMPEANPTSTQLFRKSLALQQKATIEAGLDMLQREVYTKSPLTTDGSKIQQNFAETITNFIKQARNVQPKGQVIITSSAQWKHIRMEDQDIINIPNITDLVRVDGEVLAPTSVVARSEYEIGDYLKEAGGISNIGDYSSIVIIAQNGSIRKCDLGWSSWASSPTISGGDQIMVLPKTSTQALTVAATVAQMIYQVAIATRVVITP